MADYKIQKGDTLTKIANKNNTTVSELAKLNNIENINEIAAGATIKLPGSSSSATNAPAPVTGSPPPSAAANESTIGQVMSDMEINDLAKQLYTPQYNQAVQSVNNQHDNAILTLDNAMADYESGVDEARDDAQQRIRNEMIKKGMGRSDYSSDRLAQAFADIGEEVANYQKQIDAQKLAATNQRSDALALLAADFEANVSNKAFDIRNQQTSMWQWQKEFDLALQNMSKGGGGGGLDMSELEKLIAGLTDDNNGDSNDHKFTPVEGSTKVIRDKNDRNLIM